MEKLRVLKNTNVNQLSAREEAGVECNAIKERTLFSKQENPDMLVDSPIESSYSIDSPEWMDICIESKLFEWGYTPSLQ